MRLTKHAVARALDMAVTGDEIRECYEHPENTYWSRKHQCWTQQRGRLALSIREDPTEDVIVTVLWSTAEAWQADYEHGELAGRKRRTDLSHLHPFQPQKGARP